MRGATRRACWAMAGLSACAAGLAACSGRAATAGDAASSSPDASAEDAPGVAPGAAEDSGESAPDGPAGQAGDGGTPQGPEAGDGGACLTAPSGLLAWWPGEGNATDATGQYNASPTGTVGFAPGKVGQAFSFSGKGFELAPFTHSGPTTVDAWVQAASVNQALFTSAISSGKPTHYDPFFQLECDGNGHWAVDVGTGADEITPVIGAVATSFQHLAVTFDGAAAMTVYLNGQQAATARWTGAMPIAYEVLKIGTNRDENHPFVGLIDEIHIFNRALSATEVAAIYGAGSAGLCP